jgi:hypothetical protein
MAAPAIIAEQRARAAAAKARERRHAEPRRRPPRDIEGPTHRAILRYLRATLPYAYIVQHTPNNPRSATRGKREKANGAVAGWPDLAIYGPDADGRPSAWFLEIKPPTGKGLKKRGLSDDQIETHDALKLAGFDPRVARSIDDAREAVAAWGLPSLDMRIPDPTGGRA